MVGKLKDMMMRKVQETPASSEPVVEDGDSIMDSLDDSIMLRPDGYYWQAPDGKQMFGPFESKELALADMEVAGEEVQEPGETLQEAEDEIGIADWIDPETGEPAEGQSRPRLEE
jgi:hypothetical protein